MRMAELNVSRVENKNKNFNLSDLTPFARKWYVVRWLKVTKLIPN